jgi:hypothetical protein
VSSTRTKWFALTASAAAVVAAVALIAVLGSHGSASAATVYSDYSALDSTAPSGITTVSSRKEAEAVTGPVWIERPAAKIVGPEIATARPVTVGVPGLRVWAAKSTNAGICIIAYASAQAGGSGAGLGSSCSREGRWVRGATMEMTVYGSSRPYLVGLVPDDVTSVTLQLDNGGSTTISASHNVYATQLLEGASSVSFTTAGSQQTVNLGGQ